MMMMMMMMMTMMMMMLESLHILFSTFTAITLVHGLTFSHLDKEKSPHLGLT